MKKIKFIKTWSLVLSLAFCLAQLAKADIPPDPGYTRVPISLEIETREDLSNYRFFFDFAGAVKEVFINSKGQTTINPMGGGARFSGGTLWAVPKKSLTDLGNELDSLSPSLRQNKVPGAIELVRHSFSRTVPDAEADHQTTPKYRLERDDTKGLKLIKTEDQTQPQTPSGAKTNEPISKPSETPTNSSWKLSSSAIIGVGLIALALFLVGFWFFRKK